VKRYWHPGEYEAIREAGKRLGFKHVEAGPFVRSSYHAGEQSRAATGSGGHTDA
jgi:lipoic acid synthetase